MRPRGKARLLACILLLIASVFAKAQALPSLSVARLQNQQLELSWPDSADGFVLEQSDALEAPAAWTGITAGLRLEQGAWRFTVDSATGDRFFRLRQIASSPPQLALSTVVDGGAEEGQLIEVWAIVTGNVQVQRVDFLLDDQVSAVVTNFPFRANVLTPLRSATKTNFTLQARLADSAGKTVLSEKHSFLLLADVRAPSIAASSPGPGSLQPPIDTVEILFAEPVQPELVREDSVRLVNLGAGEQTTLAADKVVPGLKYELRADRRSLLLRSTTKLRPGFYGIQIRPPLADLVGNTVVPIVRRFRVFDPADTDQDGVPDELESSLGLIVGKFDSDGNGRSDGLEDFDKDGLSNAFEILHGRDPARADTDGNGIKDGDEDRDHDGLTDAQEALLGTDPTRPDTDGDGWTDEAEVSAGSNPLDPSSVAEFLVVTGRPFVEILLPAAPALPQEQGPESGLTMANPSMTALLPANPRIDLTGDGAAGLTLATPLIRLVIPAAPLLDLSDSGLTMARPAVEVVLPSASQLQIDDAGLTMAMPPAIFQIGSNNPANQQIQ